jgi:hypothetical protein
LRERKLSTAPSPERSGKAQLYWTSLQPGDLVETRSGRWLCVVGVSNGAIETRGTDGRAVYLPRHAYIAPVTDQKIRLRVAAEILRRTSFFEKDTAEQYDQRRRQAIATLGLFEGSQWAALSFNLAKRLSHGRSD